MSIDTEGDWIHVMSVEDVTGPIKVGGWKVFLPCAHECVSLKMENDNLIFECLVPGCEKSNAIHKDDISFDQLLDLMREMARQASGRDRDMS